MLKASGGPLGIGLSPDGAWLYFTEPASITCCREIVVAARFGR